MMGLFLVATATRPFLGPIHPHAQMGPGAVTSLMKRLGLEADHPTPYSADVKNAWSYTSSPPVCLYGVVFN